MDVMYLQFLEISGVRQVNEPISSSPDERLSASDQPEIYLRNIFQMYP